jgi:hypothetical protein
MIRLTLTSYWPFPQKMTAMDSLIDLQNTLELILKILLKFFYSIKRQKSSDTKVTKLLPKDSPPLLRELIADRFSLSLNLHPFLNLTMNQLKLL